MKRILALLFVVVMMIALVGCGNKTPNNGGNNNNDSGSTSQQGTQELGNGTISETAKAVAEKFAIKYEDMYADTYGVIATEYPADKKDQVTVFSKKEKSNEERKSDIIGFINYFKTISDDKKVYYDKDFEVEWEDVFYTSTSISVMVWAFKKGGKNYSVQCSQSTQWSAEASANLYAYIFNITELIV